MAITRMEYSLIRMLREVGDLKPDSSLIEFGEANWYGDVHLSELIRDIDRFNTLDRAEELKAELLRIAKDNSSIAYYEVARIFYACFLQHKHHVAIDYDGTQSALKVDLNEPLDDLGQHDVFLSFGTAEHIFNIRQFFDSAHRVTKPGGLMVHGGPWTGHFDHGFYNFQPTLFFDLAAANGYHIRTMCYGVHDPFEMKALRSREEFMEVAQSGLLVGNCGLFVVFKKPAVERPFQTPLQGYYAKTLSPEARKAWKTMR